MIDTMPVIEIVGNHRCLVKLFGQPGSRTESTTQDDPNHTFLPVLDGERTVNNAGEVNGQRARLYPHRCDLLHI